MRIVSLLPAATEILFAIGAGNAVVGVTHECDFPPEATRKPALIRPRVNPSAAPGVLDREVRAAAASGQSIYVVDAEQLERLEPTLIVTQDLCHVCAASPEDLASALARFPQGRMPRVLTFTPHSLGDIWRDIGAIGEAALHPVAAHWLSLRLQEQVAGICNAARGSSAGLQKRPRVLCLEWFDPLYVAGHWVPEMVRLAGGRDVLGREGEPSFCVDWPQVLATQPEVVILMSCGYGVTRNVDAWRSIDLPPGWSDLPAVRDGRVYAVDANAYFSRSGPRLVEGIALLAGLLHPQMDSSAIPVPGDPLRRELFERVEGAFPGS